MFFFLGFIWGGLFDFGSSLHTFNVVVSKLAYLEGISIETVSLCTELIRLEVFEEKHKYFSINT